MCNPKLSDGTLSCTKPFTDRREILNQAGAILILLANSYSSDEEATNLAIAANQGGAAPDWAGLAPPLFHDALKGVASLIGVACHLEDLGR